MLGSAIYGFRSHRQNPVLVPLQYQAVLTAATILLLLQVVLGLSLLASGLRPASSLHIFIYGALPPLVLPATYLYARQQGKNHANLAFALASLFLFGFLIRATFTG